MDFVFLGNTSFSGLYAREHALALTLAQRGFNVVYVEGMPSLSSMMRSVGRAAFSRLGIEEDREPKELPNNLTVLIPPTIPTFFRSSWTPALDKHIFKRWFRGHLTKISQADTILCYMFPYWADGFVDSTFTPRMVIYDICDALEMPSRNEVALKRMTRSHTKLLTEADIVTFSSVEMANELVAGRLNKASFYLPNAVSTDFLASASAGSHAEARRVIGYVGSLDTRWADRELLLKVAQRFPDCHVVIRASIDGSFAELLGKQPNVELVPFMEYAQVAQVIAGFDVALMPFKQNAITRVINPLKLYEYCSSGVPIVAMRTDELTHYADLVYLSQTVDEFLSNVQTALSETDVEKRSARVAFARANTWDARTDALLQFIHEGLEVRKSV